MLLLITWVNSLFVDQTDDQRKPRSDLRGITESLMSISRMMAQQVQQSEETMSTLGGHPATFPCYPCLHAGKLMLYRSLHSCSDVFQDSAGKLMKSLKPWQELYSWAESWSLNTIDGNWQTSCLFSSLSRSSWLQSCTSWRKDFFLSFKHRPKCEQWIRCIHDKRREMPTSRKTFLLSLWNCWSSWKYI